MSNYQMKKDEYAVAKATALKAKHNYDRYVARWGYYHNSVMRMRRIYDAARTIEHNAWCDMMDAGHAEHVAWQAQFDARMAAFNARHARHVMVSMG